MSRHSLLSEIIKEDIEIGGDTRLINEDDGLFVIFEQKIDTFNQDSASYYLFLFSKSSKYPKVPIAKREVLSDEHLMEEYHRFQLRGFVRYDSDDELPQWMRHNILVKYQLWSLPD